MLCGGLRKKDNSQSNIPLVSIITVVFNGGNVLEKTIQSVINQTFSNYEYLIIDGGSTDCTLDIIRKYEDKIEYWQSEPDKGIYDAMNKGISFIRGKYCLFLNSGDYLSHNNILSNIGLSSFSEDIIYFNVYMIQNNKIKKMIYPTERDITASYFFNGTFNHQSILIRTELQKNDLYSTDFKICSDKDFLIRNIIIKNCTIRYVNDFLCYYDNENGYSSNPNNRKVLIKERNQILQKYYPERALSDIELAASVKYRFNSILYQIYLILLEIRFLIKKERS